MADPRDPHRAEREAERSRRYHDAMQAYAEPDEPSIEHLRRDEIDNCHICDHDGHTPSNRICVHQDHATATRHGRALVQAELAKIRQRKTDTARGGAA